MNEAKPYIFSGKVIVKNEIQEISDNFKKLEMVIDTGGDYPQTIPVEAIFFRWRFGKLKKLERMYRWRKTTLYRMISHFRREQWTYRVILIKRS